MNEQRQIHKDFRDTRLDGQPIRSLDDRRHAAREELIRDSVETAKRMGRDVTEAQVREEVTRMLDHSDRKSSEGAYRGTRGERKHIPDEVYVEEKGNLTEV